jgi:hypothetical protein
MNDFEKMQDIFTNEYLETVLIKTHNTIEMFYFDDDCNDGDLKSVKNDAIYYGGMIYEYIENLVCIEDAKTKIIIETRKGELYNFKFNNL